MVFPAASSPTDRGTVPTGRPAPLTRRLVVALLAVLLVLLGAGPALGDPVGVPPTGTGGAAMAWGFNDPTPPDSLTGKTVTAIAAGEVHTLALTDDGKVTAWGIDTYGQTDVPDSLTGKTVTAIATGDDHSLASTSDGAVTAWGRNNQGQTDVPASLTGKRVTALAGGYSHSLALTSDGQVTSWGNYTYLPEKTGINYGPVPVPTSLTGKTVMAIAAGETYGLALTSDGKVTAWGGNPEGALKPPDSLTGKNVTAIAAGGFHSLALTSDGTVTAWGNDKYGQSDVPDSLTGKTVVAIAGGFTFSLALTSDGQIIAWGSNTYGQLNPPALNGKIPTAIATGFSHGVLIAANPVAPHVSVSPQDVHVQAGVSATFTASASGAPVPTIQWQRQVGGGKFTNIPGATGSFYTTPPATGANNNDRYRAVFTNDLGTVTSGTATLVVDPTAPTAPTISSVTGGDASATVTFTPGQIGYPVAKFDVTATPATGPAVTRTDVTSPTSFNALTNGIAYNFTVTAKNSVGSATSTTFGPVTPGVTPTISGTPPATVMVGTGYSFGYTLGGKPAPTTTVVSGALPDGLSLSSDGQITGTPTAAGTFNFAVQAANPVGSHTTTTSTITVTAAPGAPTISEVTGGDSSAIVTFTPGTAGYPAPTTFDVTATPTDGSPVTVSDVTSPATVPGLNNGVAYTFTVTAKNSLSAAADSAPYGPVIGRCHIIDLGHTRRRGDRRHTVFVQLHARWKARSCHDHRVRVIARRPVPVHRRKDHRHPDDRRQVHVHGEGDQRGGCGDHRGGDDHGQPGTARDADDHQRQLAIHHRGNAFRDASDRHGDRCQPQCGTERLGEVRGDVRVGHPDRRQPGHHRQHRQRLRRVERRRHGRAGHHHRHRWLRGHRDVQRDSGDLAFRRRPTGCSVAALTAPWATAIGKPSPRPAARATATSSRSLPAPPSRPG